MLDLANRNYIVISDSDKPAVEQQKAFRGDGRWIRYNEYATISPAVTSEDFLTPEAFKDAIANMSAEIPNLPQLPLPDLADPRGKLAALRSWLASANLTSDQIKGALDRLKDDVFDKLKPAQIEPAYYDFLSSIASLV